MTVVRFSRLGLPALLTLALALLWGGAARADEQALVPRAYIPMMSTSSAPQIACAPVAGYGTLTTNGPPTDRPPAQHADLNLALRGYSATSSFNGLVDYGGATDPGAPQLYGLFSNQRTPSFSQLHRVNSWNWGCDCRGGPITAWPVTLLDAAAAAGERIYLPDRAGGDIGQGFKALVLYAEPTRITLKYTREDSVVWGYTLHLERVRVDPTLLALYQACDREGRARLPALRGRALVGTATSSRVGVAIRDTGRFMDPRSRKDWWAGR